ncbi:MAG: hypothetical protein LBG79_04440 [Spirochaetaceae bacterium]|jgi:tetratricopeptide (TPR) repeat protein|nr:hypothetical protein [Spirochaetaceae bacterium]
MAEQTGVEPYIREALLELKAGHADEAVAFLEDALRVDSEDAETLDVLKCLHWWLEKFEAIDGISTPYDEGFFLMGQWPAFYEFLETIGSGSERCRYAVRHFVYAFALRSFEKVLADPAPRHDPALLLRVGRCYKGVGNYEEALKFLQKAAQFRQQDGAALAELADVHALLGEEKLAKVLFREAFFIDPEGIDINSLECEMIVRLAERARAMGVGSKELPLWLPVYGALLGVLSVKRELKRVELGKLNQEVFALEDEVRKNTDDTSAVPRLLNRYLWLLDHYEICEEDESAKISEIQLRIKLIDPQIYDRYMSIKS